MSKVKLKEKSLGRKIDSRFSLYFKIFNEYTFLNSKSVAVL